MTLTTSQEYSRVVRSVSTFTVSIPMSVMTSERIIDIETRASSNQTLNSLNIELRKKLKAILRPEDYTQMAQAYEAYSEASFWLSMSERGVFLERTPGTGQHSQRRPDFVYRHNAGDIYFEIKALEIVSPLTRHQEMANEGLEILAKLDECARRPGIHISEPIELSGTPHEMTLAERLNATIDKIENNIKREQIQYGPTVLVVDLGRLETIPYGPSSLLPVFFHDKPPAESCVSGELWNIGFGRIGERLFGLPAFDGKSNLAGHLERDGILVRNPALMAITFMHPRWSEPLELFTLWNPDFDRSALVNPPTLSERQIEEFLYSYSDGVNDSRNEEGWYYRVTPLRPK